MSFENAVRQYLQEVDVYVNSALATGETTPELSYRPVLDRFLRDVSQLYSPNIEFIFEPKRQGQAGHPDWRVYNTVDLGLYGYVEAKAFDPESQINIAPYMAQITKYLTIGAGVILTDGLEFVFFDPGNITTPHRHSLVPKPLHRVGQQNSQIDHLVEGRLREFFRESGFRQCSEEQLIREMAIRAARLSEDVLALSQAPIGSGHTEEESKTIEILHDLQSTLRLHHDPVLKHPNVFADFVAQILSFGLLYAHRVVADEPGQPRDRYDAIRRFWTDAVYANYTDRLIPFKALVKLLETELAPAEESTSRLRCWYDDTRRLLAHILLRDNQIEIPDYHTLYEKFLAKFDPKTRFDFGAFYTPRELASFTVRMSNAIIETHFGGRHLYEEGNKVIDPCCGTGTFLEQLVRHSTNGAAVHLIGFEILPAPYALAHYRMLMLDVPESPLHEIDIILTNTLSDELASENGDHPNSVLRDELRRARDCARPPIVLVIGNPPSSDSFGPHSTGTHFSTIDKLLENFRPPRTGRRTRQNTQKQIGNDFMKFLRWSADKVLSSEMGALALVLPSSFAAHPTYRHAREWLIAHFSEFWLLDIDRDLRTGVRSSSLFNTQQGRMLLIATHTGTVSQLLEGRVYCAAITDQTRAQKRDFLIAERSNEEHMALFALHNIDEESKSFRPVGSGYDRQLYEQFWAIHPARQDSEPGERCVFVRHVSGVKLAPTALFVHPRRLMLQRRTKEIGDASNSYADLHSRWFKGQKKPPAEEKLTSEVRARLKIAAPLTNHYRPYAFRPFVSEQLLLDTEVLGILSRIGGGGSRVRPELVCAFSESDTVGIAIAPSPLDIGDDLHRFATFCWDLPDNDLCSRLNAHVFCNAFPAYKTGRGEWDPTPRNNISDILFARATKVLPDITPTDIVFYVYATLCSGALLEAFAEAYFTSSATENIPRVPLVRDANAIRFLIEKGRKLALLENPREVHELEDWVLPLQAFFMNPFNLKEFKVDDEQGEVRLYGDGTQPEVTMCGIPGELLQLTISGYPVVKNWLKFHSYSYTRTEFRQEDFRKLLELLSVLSRQFSLIEEIDVVMDRIIRRDLELL